MNCADFGKNWTKRKWLIEYDCYLHLKLGHHFSTDTTMTSMALDLPRRFPWPTLLALSIHGAVIAGLLYTSVNQVVELPAPAQPMSITLVAPPQPEPVVQPPAPEPVVEQEPEPEPVPEPPKEAPVVIEKPKPKPEPKPKPKPKPVKKVEQPKRDVKPAEPRPASPFENAAPSRTVNNTPPAAKPAVTAPTGPRALARNQPSYPARALALRVEGKVRVKFDVTADGRVDNVQILSAQPSNMFEREVKTAMRKWRYESGKPGNGLIMNIEFRINGGVKIN